MIGYTSKLFKSINIEAYELTCFVCYLPIYFRMENLLLTEKSLKTSVNNGVLFSPYDSMFHSL